MFADNNTTGNNLIGATGNNLTFWTSSAEKMRLTSGGNVLIGTTTDNNSKLRILGATSDTTKSALEVRNSNSLALFTVRNDGRIDASGAVNLSGSLTGTTATFSGAVGTGTITTSTGNIKGSSHLFFNAQSSFLN